MLIGLSTNFGKLCMKSLVKNSHQAIMPLNLGKHRLSSAILHVISLMLCVTLTGCGDSPETLYKHDERGLYAAEFSKNADRLLISTVNKSAQFWDFQQNKLLRTWTLEEGNQTDIAHVALSKNGKIALTSDSYTMVVWDTKTGKSIGFWELPSFIVGLEISENGQYALVAYADRSVQLIDVAVGRPVWKAIHEAYIEDIALSADGHYAMVGCDDNTATLWDIHKGKRKHLWEETTRIRHVAISPDNQYALTSAPFRTIKIWDIQSGKLKYELAEHTGIARFFGRNIINVSSASFSEDSSLLITGSPPRNVHLWDLTTGKMREKWVLPKLKFWKPTSSIIYASAISTDKKWLYVESSNGHGYRWSIPEN